ncbi:hypothetical protein [Microbulbifer magnicolonia]|uniref:hypothetical protein n=1 Tax=Microbulbifer magnicolonia TaxID=3109744 RepID=UPI002B405B7C|nr:hypothetical protein [Microbulbifer sp. GG15]
MSEMFIQIHKYGIEYRRSADHQGVITMVGVPFRVGGGENIYLTLRFREIWDDRREEIGEWARNGRTGDDYPGEGPVQVRPTIVNMNDSEVYVDLPMRDFAHMRHMLQTESPVYAKWKVENSGSPSHRDYFALASFAESPGEGFSDGRD